MQPGTCSADSQKFSHRADFVDNWGRHTQFETDPSRASAGFQLRDRLATRTDAREFRVKVQGLLRRLYLRSLEDEF